jgi:acyl-CoA synthetase (AMP-forming)/AMP-acid ligase II
MFVPLIEKMSDNIKTVNKYVVMTDKAHMPKDTKLSYLCYEELLETKPGKLEWPVFPDTTASCLCYTSGTTGNPKGVLFEHKSTVIHSYMFAMGSTFGLSSDTVLLPIVPMFHVNAWCLIYAGPMCGSKLVLPGCKMDG